MITSASNTSDREILYAIALFGFAFIVFIFSLRSLIDANPIVADGYQNLSVARNIINHTIFSSTEIDGATPTSDMQREPAWPFLTALFIYILSLDHPTAVLAAEFSFYFKYFNLSLYSLAASVASSFVYLKSRKVILSLLVLVLFLLVYGTTPRLINNFNNEALATLFLLVASILFYVSILNKNRGGIISIVLGLVLGVLALTKAQYLYICFPLALVLLFVNRRNSVLAISAFAVVVSPWIFRNYELFNEPAIAKRGKTVLAVRIILTSEPSSEERLCMAYAFTHPSLQHYIEKTLGINNNDFIRGRKCQRLNRETCFDMGTVKVRCSAFPEDQYTSDYSSKIQLFYKGFHAGQQIEEGNLRFADLFLSSPDFFMKYITTFPLFVWRGMGFSDYPLVAVMLTISTFALLFTRYWSFSLLCVSSFLFHVSITHNIPRYQATLFPIMIISFVFLIYLAITRDQSLLDVERTAQL